MNIHKFPKSRYSLQHNISRGLSPALSRPHLSSTWIGEGFGATFFAKLSKYFIKILSEIMHSIKSFTAHEIGKSIWQHENFDRIIRDSLVEICKYLLTGIKDLQCTI